MEGGKENMVINGLLGGLMKSEPRRSWREKKLKNNLLSSIGKRGGPSNRIRLSSSSLLLWR
jgi:hypothetical protein